MRVRARSILADLQTIQKMELFLYYMSEWHAAVLDKRYLRLSNRRLIVISHK